MMTRKTENMRRMDRGLNGKIAMMQYSDGG